MKCHASERRLRSFVPLAAFVLIAVVAQLTPPASAESVDENPKFCATLRELVDAAGDAFRPIRGAVKHGPLGVWVATKAIPGGSDCRVFGGPLPIYGCTLYLGDDGRQADDIHHAAAEQVAGCLGSDWTSTEFATGVATQTVLSRPGKGPVVRLASRIAHAVGYEVHFWIDGR